MAIDPIPRARWSAVLWTVFFSIAVLDVLLPGPSFSVLCLPVFFAVVVLVRPRSAWPLAWAAACFLVGAWLLEEGLRRDAVTASLASYRLVDRGLICFAILAVTGLHSRLQRVHDAAAALQDRKDAGRLDAAGSAELAALGRSVHGLVLASLALVFAFDALTPRNWNVGILYLLPVLWASALGRTLPLALIVPATALLSFGAFVLGPASTVLPEPPTVLVDRAVSILTLLASGTVLAVHFAWEKDRKGRRRGFLVPGRDGPG